MSSSRIQAPEVLAPSLESQSPLDLGLHYRYKLPLGLNLLSQLLTGLMV